MTARELTPAEQWARYDFGVAMIRTLGAWGAEALAVGYQARAQRCAVAKAGIERIMGAPPACDRPEEARVPGVDLHTARELASEVEAGQPFERILLAEWITDLCDEVDALRLRVAALEGAPAAPCPCGGYLAPDVGVSDYAPAGQSCPCTDSRAHTACVGHCGTARASARERMESWR